VGVPPRRRHFLRWRTVWLALLLVILSLAGFTVYTYLAFASEWSKSTDRIDGAVQANLDRPQGNPAFEPVTTLILGVDRREYRRAKLAYANRFARTDTIMLMRTDPDSGRVAYLSIPRDTMVEIDPYGFQRINSAFFFGQQERFGDPNAPEECRRARAPALVCGIPLTLTTVKHLLGIEINHVMLINFSKFPALIDAVGGVDVNVPRALNARFEGKQHVFRAGPQHMDGKRAQEFSRVRNGFPADNDYERGKRQQILIKALQAKFVRPGNIRHSRELARGAAEAITTDLEPREVLGLAWTQWRADDKGEPAILPVLPNPNDLNTFVVDGDRAPQAIAEFRDGR
jgi:LCP family protein required for cell wall assembly